ncbi:MAG: TonB-dependent receptor [Marinicaulis sp.]|nr:TonB-dependent receptor [Marinicaulis sp.]
MNTRNLLLSAASLAVLAPLSANAQDEDHKHADDEIIVTSSPIAHPEHESIIAASVLTEEELATMGEASLGQLLRREPGISATFFGPAASRPVIRGLSGDRISVLDAGIGSIDASAVSDDHAVAVEPATAERIEIVRGAATLYYGSSAAGGVVNVFDGRIPDNVPEGGVDGALRTSIGSVDDSVEAAGGFDADFGKVGNANFVLHADGFYRSTDDYNIPGFAESAALRALEEEESEEHDEEEETFGIVENSDFETKGGSLGGSLVFEDGFFGISGKIVRSNYGVPGGGHHHEEEEGEEEGEEEEETVRIDLEQERLDLMGEINKPFMIFETVKVRFGYADYIHRELEGAEIGTTFKNEGYEGRIELIEKEFGDFRGASGFQFKHRDFEAIGDEAFTPPNITDQFGVFTVREYETGPFHFQLAGRYEHTSTEARTVSLSRDFDAFSVSGGVGYEPNENLFLGLNVLRTERAPAPEELFSNGPHLATNAFEIGDPTLGKETALGIEATLHGEAGPLELTLNGFYADYNDFIALIPNGEEEDELPVFEFLARDAVFKGFEAEADADLFSIASFDVAADAQVDFVRANFKDGGGDIPRIPPLRTILGLEATSSHFDIRGEVEIAAEQSRVAADELPTDGYTLVNLAATWRPGGEDHGLSVQLRADNVTNEEARLHTSFLKDVAPLPGRNVKLTFRGAF